MKRAYLKTEKGTPLTLEGYKFTTECLAGVMVPVGEVNIVLLRILNKMTCVSIASKFLTVII